jgi:hypothetical protein
LKGAIEKHEHYAFVPIHVAVNLIGIDTNGKPGSKEESQEE